MKLKVAIIGCGLIGAKRARALGSVGHLVACIDLDLARARSVAASTGAFVSTDYRDLLERADIDMVIIATTHNALAEITLAFIRMGKHVFVEKPAARNTDELRPVLAAAELARVKVHVGFNHRYHRAMQKTRQILDAGVLGELMFIRARYGHGGRIGYDREWRADPKMSGGGEMIDQGPHLIDLSRWFLGEFTDIQGFAHTYFWDMPVDDNGFMLLRTQKKQTAFLHVTTTEWKNLFSMEIYGKNGKLEISGLGGSYGVERLTHYHMLPEMGPPETTAWEYPMGDDSWAVELNEFYEDIRLDRTPAVGLADAFAALSIVERIYKESGHDHRP